MNVLFDLYQLRVNGNIFFKFIYQAKKKVMHWFSIKKTLKVLTRALYEISSRSSREGMHSATSPMNKTFQMLNLGWLHITELFQLLYCNVCVCQQVCYIGDCEKKEIKKKKKDFCSPDEKDNDWFIVRQKQIRWLQQIR